MISTLTLYGNPAVKPVYLSSLNKNIQDQLLYQASILENISDIIITTDLEFRVVSWNKGAEKYYGHDALYTLGKRMMELVSFEYLDSSREQAAHQLLTNGIWTGEVAVINQEKKSYFVKTVKYLLNQHGEKIGILATGRDITSLKTAEEKIRASELFYRTLIADSLDGMIILDQEGKISFSSPSVKHVLGYDPHEIEGRSGFEFVHPSDLTWALDSFQKEVVHDAEIKFIIIRLLKNTGEWLWCMVRGNNLLNHPSVNGIVIYFHDDTLRKAATEALKESEKRFRSLIKDLSVGVVLQDKEGKILLRNNAFNSIYDITEEESLNATGADLTIDPIHEDGRKFEKHERPTYRATQLKLPSRDMVMGIYRPRKKDRVWILINIHPVLDEQGEVTHVVSTVIDITERKRIEQQQLDHQKQLTQASIEGQENERREVGKELHDNIGQQLTTVKLFLDYARTSADDATIEMINLAVKGVADVINEVRAMSRSLVPYTLKDLGLAESINELMDPILRTTKVSIYTSVGKNVETLPDSQKLTLFRITQEQTNNIVKYAKATEISIDIQLVENEIHLEITDNGIGFDPEKVKKGLGIANIRNRAEIFGGSAVIKAEPDCGCELFVRLPILTEDKPASDCFEAS